jgi:hypothetical protein
MYIEQRGGNLSCIGRKTLEVYTCEIFWRISSTWYCQANKCIPPDEKVLRDGKMDKTLIQDFVLVSGYGLFNNCYLT